jgi:BAT2 N-terminus
MVVLGKGRGRGTTVKPPVKVAAPKPINLPSLKSENLGFDPSVPAVGAGWGSGKSSDEQTVTPQPQNQNHHHFNFPKKKNLQPHLLLRHGHVAHLLQLSQKDRMTSVHPHHPSLQKRNSHHLVLQEVLTSIQLVTTTTCDLAQVKNET